MTIARYNDWPERLFAFFDARRQDPFEWGKNDCAIFFADAVQAMTGMRIGEQFRSYRSASGSRRVIRDAGGMHALLEALKLDEIEIGFATRGDISLASMEGREIFGVVAGNGFYFSPGEDGLLARPITEVSAVFRF